MFAAALIPVNPDAAERLLNGIYLTFGLFFLFAFPLLILAADYLKKGGRGTVSAAALVTALFLLTGCWDGIPVENRSFVTAIAVDKAEDGNGRYTVALLIPELDKGGENITQIQKTEVNSLEETLEKFDAKNDKRIYLGQAKILLLGEALLSDRKLLDEAVKTIDAHVDLNRQMAVISTQANINGDDAFKTEASFLVDWFKRKAEPGGFTYTLDFLKFHEAMNGRGDIIIPSVKTEDGGPVLSGGVMLRGGALTDTLDGNEMRGYLWSETGRCDETVITAEGASFKVKKHSVSFKFTEEGGFLECVPYVNIMGEGGCSGDFADVILQEITAAFNKASAAGADIYDIYGRLRKENVKLHDRFKDDWEEVYVKMLFEPQVSCGRN